MVKLLWLLSLAAVTAHLAAPSQAADVGHAIVFEQPSLDGVEGNFHVPKAEHRYPSEHSFNLLLWQPNPGRSDGQLVPTRWNAGAMTGFYPQEPVERHQAAFRDSDGSSTVQIDDGTVGVYLNSRELPDSTPGKKMMITPEFKPKEAIYPFEASGTELDTELELQVPVATDQHRPGNLAYVVSDLVLEDRTSRQTITFEVKLFHHNPGGAGAAMKPEHMRRTEVGKYDEYSHTFQVGSPIAPGSRVCTTLPGTALYQTDTWTGWRPFRFAITRENLEAAVHDLKESAPQFHGSDNPADYRIVNWHLNAELTFASGPAELGWSMRHARLEIAPNGGH